jgi:hypothetical protein
MEIDTARKHRYEDQSKNTESSFLKLFYFNTVYRIMVFIPKNHSDDLRFNKSK